MPWSDSAQQRLPYQSGSDTSHDAAVMVGVTGRADTQRLVMAALYRAHRAGLTDAEMAHHTGYQISAICARRNELGCVALGRRMGPHGVMVTAWALEA